MALLTDRVAVLFDLDDTLIDFSGNTVAAWRDASMLAADRLPGLDQQRFVEAIEQTREWYWSDPDRHTEGRRDLRVASAEIVRVAMEGMGVRPPPELPRQVADYYRDLRDDGQSLVRGARELLERYCAEGRPLALVTNGSTSDQRAKIDRFDLERYFDHIQIEGEFGLGKPHEPVYRAALDALGVPAEEAWFVGDNLEWDVAAPQRLGMRAVWVDLARTGAAPPPVVPDRMIEGVWELLEPAPGLEAAD
ncbi:MAG: HAD-IA family hydrolase [Dehalococcoidia bacterium]|nr:HAD-IA family hydrolase [Dehalococcoidia bacterium]